MKSLLTISLAVLIALSGDAYAVTPGFCAHSSVAQTGWQAGVYKQFLADTIREDSSQRYSTETSTWEPIKPEEEAQRINLFGQIQVNTGIPAGSPVVIVAKVVKNEMQDIQAGETITTGNALGAGIVQFHAQDVAQPGDYYWVILNISAISGSLTLDNNKSHTYFCGAVLK